MILNALVERLERRAKGDFKGRHYEATLILQAVSWYLRYPLSYRDIEEMFLERGFAVDHSTLNRWVLAYAPLIERRLRSFRKMLQDEPLLAPDRIGTDAAAPYPPAIAAARKDGLMPRTPLHYVTKHLQQGIESDHFRVKRPMPRIGCFQAFHTARRTIQGFEPCCGCARASGLWAPGRCANRTGCSRSASDFQRLTKCKVEADPVHPAAYVRVCDRPASIAVLLLSICATSSAGM